MSKMRPTQGVSFPRSGHKIVYNVAKQYFGESMVYCDPDNEQGMHCSCDCVPCVNLDRTFSKFHDFGLMGSPGTPILADERYFVQYRSPVWSITSNFKLYIQARPQENHRDGWRKFAYRDIFYWNRFVDKWVLDFPSHLELPLYCLYEELLKDPIFQLKAVLRFLSAEPLDEQRAEQIIQDFKVAPRNNLANFEFYEPDFFRDLEEVARERLELLKLPLFGEAS